MAGSLLGKPTGLQRQISQSFRLRKNTIQTRTKLNEKAKQLQHQSTSHPQPSYALLLLAVCVIPFKLAQRSANNRSVAPETSRNFNPATAQHSTEADQAQPTVSSGAIGVPSTLPPHPKAPQVIS